MNLGDSQNWLEDLSGWLGSDIYSTAWVALVPGAGNPERPAWPQTLDYIRSRQHKDGGWGEPHVYYAHERVLSTLAAIKALHAWQTDPEDSSRIARGLEALKNYAVDLLEEPHEPVGFELLVPRLLDDLKPVYKAELPLDVLAPVEALHQEKISMLDSLQPTPSERRAWWVSMEVLPDGQLARLDDSLLEVDGSIASSTAATAAYLAARRRAGGDSPAAAGYLTRVMKHGCGGVPFCWPADILEQIWGLDSFRRIGLDPKSLSIAPVVRHIRRAWDRNVPGFSYNNIFPLNDGDDTLTGFAVLCWAGVPPPNDEPVLGFFDHDRFLTYMDERHTSISANIHGLSALREQPGFPHRDLAEKVSVWLKAQMKPDVLFEDKWHLSPAYSIAHAIPAFAGWDDQVALRCVDFLFERQRDDGGWGWFARSTLEETAHCVIGLAYAYRQGLFRDTSLLARAGRYFDAHAGCEPVERLWIGKTLFYPSGIVKAVLFSAQAALTRLGCMSRQTAA